MLQTVIKPNSYQDSINLMLLTNKINTKMTRTSSTVASSTWWW